MAIEKYRGNYGRPLVYLKTKDGTDFQEIMISEGYSPYFQKYGQAHTVEQHLNYSAAEKHAQSENSGIWDQIANNGAVMRNYAALGVWWELRGRIIEEYRTLKRTKPDLPLFNTRLDYPALLELAKEQTEVTIFMELRSFSPIGGDHMVFSSGSEEQPFKLFIPDGNTPTASKLMNMLITRYISGDNNHPRRSYAYVTGKTKMFPDDNGTPEMILTDTQKVTDWPCHLIS